MFVRRLIVCSAALATLILPLTVTAQITIVNEDFEDANFAATGLFDFSNRDAAALDAGTGVGGSQSLNNFRDGAVASATRTIDQVINFSMFAEYNGATTNGRGGLSFGWTQATGTYNPYSGSATGVSETDHVIVGLAKTGTTDVRLAGINNGHDALGGGLFHSNGSDQPLTSGNWYRLEGTVVFDDLNKSFTFQNVSLDDFGPTGAAEVTANLLSGSGVVAAPTFGTTGRVVFQTNSGRIASLTDNYLVEAPVVGSELIAFQDFESATLGADVHVGSGMELGFIANDNPLEDAATGVSSENNRTVGGSQSFKLDELGNGFPNASGDLTFDTVDLRAWNDVLLTVDVFMADDNYEVDEDFLQGVLDLDGNALTFLRIDDDQDGGAGLEDDWARFAASIDDAVDFATLSFLANGLNDGTDLGTDDEAFFIDNVTFTGTFDASFSVPEPSAIAIWTLLGLIAAGFAWRRR